MIRFRQKLAREKDLETALVFCAMGLVVYFVTREEVYLPVVLVIAGVGLFLPPVISLVTRAWFTVSDLLGMMTSRAMLTIVFFVVVVPVSFFWKRAHRETLRSDTYFFDRSTTIQPEHLDHPW